jgi:photosystem II stability/assembly factor-like uncharacterized protein
VGTTGVTTSELYRSTDGGEHWARVFRLQGPQCDPQWKLAARGRTAYAGTYDCPGGVYRTTDGGKSWTSGRGLPRGAAVSAIAIDPRTPRVVYASVFSRRNGRSLGFFRSRDTGEHWQRVDRLVYDLPRGWSRGYVLNFSSIVINPREPHVIYGAGTQCVKSTDDGRAWRMMLLDGNPLPCISLAMDPKRPEVLYAGSGDPRQGLLKTTDGGRTWVVMRDGLPSQGLAQKLAVDAKNSALVYAAVNVFFRFGRVFRSTNGGRSWAGASRQVRGDGRWTELVADPAAAGTAYAAGWFPKGAPAQGPGVLKTSNGGRSWTPKNEGLPPSRFPYDRGWVQVGQRPCRTWRFDLEFRRDVVSGGPLMLLFLACAPFGDRGQLNVSPDFLRQSPVAINVTPNGTFSHTNADLRQQNTQRCGGPDSQSASGARWPGGRLTMSGRIESHEIRGTLRVFGPALSEECPGQIDSGPQSFVARCFGNCDPPALARIDALAVG